jgi:putative ABC transport system permease protein
MLATDFVRLTAGSIRSQRMRAFLAASGIAVGIAAVILLTSIGQGVRDYVLSEFAQFGTNLMLVMPGRVRTAGASIGVFGSVRPITIEDAIALRNVRGVEVTNPGIDGNAEVSAAGKHRRITIFGMGPDWPAVAHMRVAMGSFLPHEDLHAARPLAVLGAKVKQELFGAANPLGKRVDISGSRFYIVGVMESKGQFVGMDLDDTVFIPVARAQEVFNRNGLTAIDVLYDPEAQPERVIEGIRRLIVARHGRDDVTIITQREMVRVLGSVLGVLTFAVGALGSISLLVGGVGILTIMTIAVNERTPEIGLLRALGARREQILALFLGEAALLAAAGGAAGLLLGVSVARLMSAIVPALPVSTPWWFAVLAEAIATFVGLTAGVLPAHRAAQMQPVDALRSE